MKKTKSSKNIVLKITMSMTTPTLWCSLSSITHIRSTKQVANRMARVDASQGLSTEGISLAPRLIKCHRARSLGGIDKAALSFWFLW